MRPIRIACLLAFSSVAFFNQVACVTVNVNFPESAVQKATDDYVRDLYRAKERGKSTSPETPSPAPASDSKSSSLWEHLELIPQVHAADDDVFKVNTEKAMKIREKLAGRLNEVLAQKRAGVLGETQDGKLTIQAPSKLKPILKKKVESLVSEENKDRNELYEEILTANGLKSNRMINIQKSFARSFQAESPSGTWVESPDGKWAQKP